MMFISGLPSHFGMRGITSLRNAYRLISDCFADLWAKSFRNDNGYSFSNEENELHIGMEFRFILDYFLDLWLIFFK